MIDQPGLRQVESLWQVPTTPPVLGQAEVHIWCIQLEALLAELPQLSQCLSPDERERVDRLRFEHLRSRFILSRAALRYLLATYLKRTPQALGFGYHPRGKPYLIDEPAFSFNLSHSEHLAVYSFAWQHPLGIDVEYLRTVEALTIAERYFSPSETDTLRALAPIQQQRAFFRYWTCKEAYLKAVGTGLIDALAQVELTLTPTDPAQLVRLPGDEQQAQHWMLQEFVPATGYVGAIALPQEDWQLKFWAGTAYLRRYSA